MEALRRFMWVKKHRRGGYAYSLIATRDGIIKEVFSKVTDGKFMWNDQEYVREPRMMRIFRNIPANFHREGVPAPIDPWNEDIADFILSCGELDIVMNAQKQFDFVQRLEKNKGIIIIGLIIVVGALLANIYFGYSAHQLLRDAGAVASGVVSAK